MSRAVGVGLAAAVLFLATLIGGALDVVFPKNPVITLVATLASIIGLVLVMIAASIVVIDNLGAANQIRQELRDVDDISDRSVSGANRLAR